MKVVILWYIVLWHFKKYIASFWAMLTTFWITPYFLDERELTNNFQSILRRSSEWSAELLSSLCLHLDRKEGEREVLSVPSLCSYRAQERNTGRGATRFFYKNILRISSSWIFFKNFLSFLFVFYTRPKCLIHDKGIL